MIIPTKVPIGSAHQMPLTPIIPERKVAAGIPMSYKAVKVVIIGISVAPAPLRKPVKLNMIEKRR